MMRYPPPANRGPIVWNKKGFNLIEAAIVLGVVGLVIGGIWIAASAVQQEYRRIDIRNAFMDAQRRVTQLYTFKPSADVSMTEVLYDTGQLVLPATIKPSTMTTAGFTHGGLFNYFAKLDSGFFIAVGYQSTITRLHYSIGFLNKADCIYVIESMENILPQDVQYGKWTSTSIVRDIMVNSSGYQGFSISAVKPLAKSHCISGYNVIKIGVTSQI